MQAVRVVQTLHFAIGSSRLMDSRARARIADRVARLADGKRGNSRSVGAGIIELKIDYGPGYRVYYVKRGAVLVVLLCGGDKSTQDKDILKAKKLASETEEE